MSNIYWDSMIFMYWLEDRAPHSDRIDRVYRRMLERGDALYASTLTLAELLVGPQKSGDKVAERRIIELFESGDVNVLPFDRPAAIRFASIRAGARVSPADAIHLACASTMGIDLFLTNDAKIRKLVVNNIQFIDGIETTVLDGG